MRDQHTQGRLELWGSANPSQVIAAPSGFVFQTLGGNDEANASRLVACWTACEGMPIDDLKACPPGGLFHLADHANQLVAQRDELLKALEEIIADMDSDFGTGYDYDKARAAIAKVKDKP